MWLVVSVLYTLGCVMFDWEKPPGGTFHLRAKAGRCPLRYSGALHHRDDSGAHRGRDLRGIGKSPCTVELNPTVGAGSEGAGSSVVGCQMPRASAGRFTQLDL
jgi:hypothetical protein